MHTLKQSSSFCPLTESALRERVDRHCLDDQYSVTLSCDTRKNLTKLQQITDDVKSLTRQLQLSIQSNKNNHALSCSLGRRFLVLIPFSPISASKMNVSSVKSPTNSNGAFSWPSSLNPSNSTAIRFVIYRGSLPTKAMPTIVQDTTNAFERSKRSC